MVGAQSVSRIPPKRFDFFPWGMVRRSRCVRFVKKREELYRIKISAVGADALESSDYCDAVVYNFLALVVHKKRNIADIYYTRKVILLIVYY